MIVYNVSLHIDDSIKESWVKWMQETHIPQVMGTGMFQSHHFFELLTRQEDETGSTFVVQYFATSMAAYERYQTEFAPALQAETRRLFEGKFNAFRTLMKKVGEED